MRKLPHDGAVSDSSLQVTIILFSFTLSPLAYEMNGRKLFREGVFTCYFDIQVRRSEQRQSTSALEQVRPSVGEVVGEASTEAYERPEHAHAEVRNSSETAIEQLRG